MDIENMITSAAKRIRLNECAELNMNAFSDAYGIVFVEETRTTRDQYFSGMCVCILQQGKCPKFLLKISHTLKSFKNNSAAYEKNFRLQDKNHAPFKLNGQSRTAFGLLTAPELQRLSVTALTLCPHHKV
jgi:hypothetical protein